MTERLAEEQQVEARVGLLRVARPTFERLSFPVLAPHAVMLDDDALLLRASDIPALAPAFVDACLSISGFHCCHLRGGVEITLERGEPFTEGTVDHVWHAAQWFTALARLVEEGPSASVGTFVWSQSSLVLTRLGPRIVVHDAGMLEGPFARPTSFLAAPFLAAMLREGRALRAACRAIVAETERRGASASRADELTDQGRDLDTTGHPPDPERTLAVIHYELTRPELDEALAVLARAVPSSG